MYIIMKSEKCTMNINKLSNVHDFITEFAKIGIIERW